MSNDIRIKKGLDISLVGTATRSISTAIRSNYYALRPEDFHGVTPKLIVKLGDKVNAGDTIFFDKSNDLIKFVSPVSGEIIEITRGDKRRIIEIKIKADQKIKFTTHKKIDFKESSVNELKNYLLKSNSKIRDTLYSSYDTYLGDKYEIKVYQNTIERLKNNFR